jgi:hypothetical protein
MPAIIQFPRIAVPCRSCLPGQWLEVFHSNRDSDCGTLLSIAKLLPEQYWKTEDDLLLDEIKETQKKK